MCFNNGLDNEVSKLTSPFYPLLRSFKTAYFERHTVVNIRFYFVTSLNTNHNINYISSTVRKMASGEKLCL